MNATRRIIGIIAAVAAMALLSAFPADAARVRDMAGRMVEVPAKARRIITTFKPATLCVLSLGLGPRLVGVDKASRHDRLQVAVYPPIARAVSVGDRGGGLNLETIIGQKPDLVVMFSQLDGVNLADRLQKLGICAVVISPESFDDIRRCLRLIAEAAGEPAAAQRAVGAVDEVMDEVSRRLGPNPQRPAVYYASPLGPLSTSSGDMLQNEMINLAGGRNVSAGLSGHFRPVSPEQLLVWRPRVIAASSYCAAALPEALASPQFEAVPAVRDGRVYVFPSNLAPWDYPSPLSALGVAWLAQKLHPRAMADMDLPALTDKFHLSLFGKSFRELGGDMDQLMRGRAVTGGGW